VGQLVGVGNSWDCDAVKISSLRIATGEWQKPSIEMLLGLAEADCEVYSQRSRD